MYLVFIPSPPPPPPPHTHTNVWLVHEDIGQGLEAFCVLISATVALSMAMDNKYPVVTDDTVAAHNMEVNTLHLSGTQTFTPTSACCVWFPGLFSQVLCMNLYMQNCNRCVLIMEGCFFAIPLRKAIRLGYNTLDDFCPFRI